MLTPQQIQDTSFEKALFGGYDMDSVDDFLEPLTADYITLYKENSVLKSKMRILVEKLEEYRKNEASVQSALLAAQKTCDQMVAEAERKCAQMLHEAEETAEAKHTEELIAEEEQRLLAAQTATSSYLDEAEANLRKQLELLQALRENHLTERHARALLRLPDEEERLRVIGLIVQGEWTVAKTEQYIDARLAPKVPQRRELGTFVLRDVRVFLNSIDHQLDLVRAAGVSASRDRQETDREIVLTIRIPKSNPPAAG